MSTQATGPDILPCPCGRKASLVSSTAYLYQKGGGWYVACIGPAGTCWHGPFRPTMRRAINAWNRVMMQMPVTTLDSLYRQKRRKA